MDASSSRTRSRPPPRLRTKTGCNTCRERRKKCDEIRPICGACDRLQIQCTWREPSTRSSTSPAISDASVACQASEATEDLAEALSNLSSINTSPTLYTGGLRTDRDWTMFQYCSTKFLRLLTSPEATPEFRDVSFVLAIGFQEPWVMHAALAPAALHASCAALIPKAEAMLYTQSALRGLRQAAQTATDAPASRDTFLTASLFLGVFEVWQCTTTSLEEED